MSYAENPYQAFGLPAAQAEVDARVDFIRKTYVHLTGAVLGFAFLCAVGLQLTPVQEFCQTFLQTRYMYLVAALCMIGVSWVCDRWAAQSTNVGTQYAGLILYTVAEAVFFLPFLWLAQKFAPGAITTAAVITAAVFLGLTLSVFITRADFSFLRSALFIGSLGAVGLVVCLVLFGGGDGGFGILISGVFVLFAVGYILYHTSMVLHHYPIGMHVAAALALFASVMTLFWYILRLVMELQRRN